ncbi:unnamed protein product [Merluccius merluccius]
MTRLLLLWALLGAPLHPASGSRVGPPRRSFRLDSSDRGLVHFIQPDIHNTTTLLLSNDGSTLYVGARNVILSLDVSKPDVITLKNKRDWSPSEEDIRACRNKQKDATECPNFVRVLQPKNSSHLYACGSYAYNPRDAILDSQTLTLTTVSKGEGRCPFNPFERSTAMTIDGELFTGTTMDFKGANPVISRHFSRDRRPDIRQDSAGYLLDEPTFISSSFDKKEGKLYFFFTEVLNEFHYTMDLKGTRLAQVCKDDVGGQRILQKKWTSFAKSLLHCQQGFDILQDMFTLQPSEGDSSEETVFYGVFTSQWSLGSESSAVCGFKMKDIRGLFSGQYKTFDTVKHQWSTSGTERTNQGKCGLWNATDVVLEVVKKSFLSHVHVRGADTPLMISSGPNGVRYSRLVAVTTQAANEKQYTVLFLLTETGFLHKVVLLGRSSWIVEAIQVFTEPQLVKSLLLSSSKDVENGNVLMCPQSITPPTEVQTDLNEVVTLPCARPSDLATLHWTSGHDRRPLPQKYFLQRPDGSLSFLASAVTLDVYICTSQEARYQEDQVVFNVTLRVPKVFAEGRAAGPQAPDTSAESLPENDNEITSAPYDPNENWSQESMPPRPTADSGTQKNAGEKVLELVRSYQTELVVVSLLLALLLCANVLVGLVWNQRRCAAPSKPQESLKNDPMLKQEPLVTDVKDMV